MSLCQHKLTSVPEKEKKKKITPTALVGFFKLWPFERGFPAATAETGHIPTRNDLTLLHSHVFLIKKPGGVVLQEKEVQQNCLRLPLVQQQVSCETSQAVCFPSMENKELE